jgi:hypothetical protein
VTPNRASLIIIPGAAEPSRRQGAENGVARRQAVLGMDVASWKELIDVFDIKQPMIPHRKEGNVRKAGGTSWYS